MLKHQFSFFLTCTTVVFMISIEWCLFGCENVHYWSWGNNHVVESGGLWISWPVCSQCQMLIARNKTTLSEFTQLPLSGFTMLGREEMCQGKWVCASVTLFFLVDLAAVSTDGKIFLSFYDLPSEDFTSV